MNPYLTGSGRSLLAAAILFIATGALSGHWVMLLIGAVLVAILALSYYGLLASALALERRLLLVEVNTPDGAAFGTLHTGRPVTLQLRIHNRAGTSLRGLTLDAHTSGSLESVDAAPMALNLPGYSALECDMSLRARETGRWFLHGFKVTICDVMGLVAVGEYVATPTALKFLPEIVVGQHRSDRFMRRKARDREGMHLVRQMGFGSDLRELRDHQAGDPFRAIAWKATARTGRLMVKDYESELVLGSYLCLDVSSTMRGGGQDPRRAPSKLEHALQLSVGYADKVTATHDRLGLITFDEKIHGHLRPRDGKPHMRKVLHHLIGVRHIVDEELTEYTDLEVAELVARYLLIHERLDFRRKAISRRDSQRAARDGDSRAVVRELLDYEGEAYDFDLLQKWVASALKEEEKRFDDPSLHTGVLGYSRLSPLRRFCHLRGIEIPYRVETRLGQKERGLVQCLEEILAHTRNSHFILIVTDLCGIMNTELIVRGLRLAQARRHKVAFLSPFTPDYVHLKPTRGQERTETLHELFTLAENEERRSIVKAIRGLGIPVVRIGPTSTLPEVTRHLGQLMRRRR